MPLASIPPFDAQQGGCTSDADCTVSDAEVRPSSCDCARAMTKRALATLRANAARVECPPDDHDVVCGGCVEVTGASCVTGQCLASHGAPPPSVAPPTPDPSRPAGS